MCLVVKYQDRGTFGEKLRRCVAHQRHHNGGREDLLVASAKVAEERLRVSGHPTLGLYFGQKLEVSSTCSVVFEH
jgi:hypothetical protein